MAPLLALDFKDLLLILLIFSLSVFSESRGFLTGNLLILAAYLSFSQLKSESYLGVSKVLHLGVKMAHKWWFLLILSMSLSH